MQSVRVILFIVSVVARGIQGHLSYNGDRLVSQNQRTIEGYIESLSTKISDFKTNYFLQLSALDVHSELIKEKLEGTALHLDTMTLLEGAFYVCVQEHRSNIPVYDDIKIRINDCATSALQYLNLFVEPAEQQLENLQNYFKKQFKKDLTNCNDDNSEESHYDCVARTIRDSNSVVIRIRKDFTRALHAAEFESEHRIKEALECGFNAFYEALLNVGETQSSLRQCLEKSQEEPLPCQNLVRGQQQSTFHDIIYRSPIAPHTPPAPNNSTEHCENVLNLSNNKLDIVKSTIQLPANGIQSNISCLWINFIEEPKSPSYLSTSIAR